MNRDFISVHSTVTLVCLVLTCFSFGCSQDNPTEPVDQSDTLTPGGELDYVLQDQQTGDQPPAGLVDVMFGSEGLQFWPYTGNSFDGAAIDPINVIFAGKVHPLQIREALMSLDGDRSAFGIPPIPPFNSEWIDIVGGNVQTTYAGGGMGWSGSVIQLTLGEFGPLRFHLRLFTTTESFGEDGGWTLGSAHFEIQIPNTTEHEVLSWEMAEQMVLVDMMRTGLLDSTIPMLPSGPINSAPSWRAIPAQIYNLLPDDLIGLIGGPPKPVTEDVPIPSDGQATVFQLADAMDVQAGQWIQTAHVDFDQVIPRPFCSEGPGDFLQITGPVDFVSTIVVDQSGRYSIESDFDGVLTGIGLDFSSGTPTILGEPIRARVNGKQKGFMDTFGERITARDKRMALGGDGPEMVLTQLKVPSRGKKSYQLLLRCFESDQ